MGAAQGAAQGAEAASALDAGANGLLCCGGASGSSCCAKGRASDQLRPPQPTAYPTHATADDAVALAADPLLCAAGLWGPGAAAPDDCLKVPAPPGFAASAKGEDMLEVPSFVGGIEEEESYEDGSSYRGQLLEGRRHGCGVWTAPTESYFGQWKNDNRDGHGRQSWQDERARRVYEGQFKAGNFDGHGRMEWHTPGGMMIYEGHYANDQKHGSGRYVWPDGRIYDGQWRYGQRWGRATFTNSAGLKRDSFWREDKLVRWIENGDLGDTGEHMDGQTSLPE
uniref:MORN repeat-containing protein 5 n=1 Tax=Pyrodinium bahamense TaxID=73915 RepID=A0A7S0A933_9DINO